MEIIDRDNFYEDTFTNFKEVTAPDREPDYISWKRRVVFQGNMDEWDWNTVILKGEQYLVDKEGKLQGKVLEKIESRLNNENGFLFETNDISSVYWFTDEGVFRGSDHWGTCRSCEWHLDMTIPRDGNFRVGYSEWYKFYKTA